MDLVHESSQGLALPFPLHQVCGLFQGVAAVDLVHESPQGLVLPFPLHQVCGLFQGAAAWGLGARIPAKPCSSVPFAPSLWVVSRRGRVGTWCTNPRKALFLRCLCTKLAGCFKVRPRGTWCTNPRKALFFRSLCTKSAGIFDTRPPANVI